MSSKQFFANQGNDDTVCLKAHKEELMQSGGSINPFQKDSGDLLLTGPGERKSL